MAAWEVLAGGGLSIVSGLGGWLLSQHSAREERTWAERQTVRQRQDEVAAKFDATLVKIMAETPRGVIEASDAAGPLLKARVRFAEALTMTTILFGEELDDRLYALDMALFVASQEAKARRGTINFWPLEIAFRDARRALAAFQKREPLPPAEFPTARELVALSDGATTMADLWEELMRRGVM